MKLNLPCFERNKETANPPKNWYPTTPVHSATTPEDDLAKYQMDHKSKVVPVL
jgi:hypothetical protein